MKAINYRIWSGELNKFLTQVWWKHDNDPDIIRTLSVTEDGMEIELSTGLKDKNNKEIFEGDIVKCELGDDNQSEIYISKVGELSGGAFWFEGKSQTGWNKDQTDQTHFPLLQTYNQQLQIIGNIHENPDLLK